MMSADIVTSIDAWVRADDTARREATARIATEVGGAAEERDGRPVVLLAGAVMAVVPGGTVTLGWDASRPLGLTDDQRKAIADDTDTMEPIEGTMAYYLTPTRRVTTLFRWVDGWPDGIPFGDETTFTGHRERTALGLRLLDDPYQVEVVSSPLGFRGGDGGTAVCGGRPNPEPWMSFASAFRWPQALWDDVVVETAESAWVRRARSIVRLPMELRAELVAQAARQ